MRRIVYWFSGLLVLMAILGLLPCPAFAKDTLIIGLQDDAASLDPAQTYETTAVGIITLAYESLVGFDGDDLTQIVPKLATSWELGDDRKTWRFHLRQGVRFANGNPVNADAVIFSLRRALTFENGPAWILAQFGITEESIIKIDDVTIQISLQQQYAPILFLSCLGHPVASILDPVEVIAHEQNGDLGSAWLEEHSAGSGPYILEQRQKGPPTQYRLKANPEYWGEPPEFQHIVVNGVQEPVEQMVMLENGAIDIAWNLGPEQISILMNNTEIRISGTLLLYVNWIVMNQGYAPLAVPDVRNAIRYALDYDGIITHILQGAGEKIQTFIPKGLLGYNPATPYALDLEKARQLLVQGGYPDGFAVELKCLNYSPWIDVATKIQADLAQIGIRVTINAMNGDLLIKAAMSRETQMLFWEWGTDYLDPDSFARAFAHSDSLGSDATMQLLVWWHKYVNQETSQLVEQAAQETDAAKRAALYEKITTIILHDGPFAILYSPIKQYGIRAEIIDRIRTPPILPVSFPQIK